MGENVVIDYTKELKQYIVATTLGDANPYPEFICEAHPGVLPTTGSGYNLWRVKKLVYDVNYQVASVMWASSNAEFDKYITSVTGYNYG